MMAEGSAPKISSIVELLASHEPASLQELSDRSPEHARRFQLGLKMGAEESPGNEDTANTEAAIIALRVVQQRTPLVISLLHTKLGRARTLRLIGSIIAAVASTGLIGAALTNQSSTITLVGAIINFIGIVCTLVAGHLETTKVGGTLATVLQELIPASTAAELLLPYLELDIRHRRNTEEAVGRVQKANELAAKLLTAERVVGAFA